MRRTGRSDQPRRCDRRAFDRLAEEASHLGADVVVGVRLHRGVHDWAAGAVDYVVNGTAARLPGSDRSDRPLLSELSGQELWLLNQAGYVPVGLVATTAVFFVSPSYSTFFVNTGSLDIN